MTVGRWGEGEIWPTELTMYLLSFTIQMQCVYSSDTCICRFFKYMYITHMKNELIIKLPR